MNRRGNLRDRRLRIEPLEDRRLLSITVNTLVDEADGSLVDGDISLRDAIALAAPGETIDFSVAGTINLTVGTSNSNRHLAIDKSLTINGPGADVLTIRAFDPTPTQKNGDGSRVFTIDDGNSISDKTVTISGLTITGGDRSSFGGGILNSERLTIDSSKVTNNRTFTQGGGICSFGSLTIESSEINGNLGLGVYVGDGELAVSASTVSRNSGSFPFGGGIFSADGIPVSLVNSFINENSGTGVRVVGAVTILNTEINRNSGDGIQWAGDVTITNSDISRNSDEGISGSGVLRVNGGSISGNSRGGISSYKPSTSGGVPLSVIISGSTISANSVFGGVSVVNGDLSIESSTISGNTTNQGSLGTPPAGGGVHHQNGELSIAHSSIMGNSVTSSNTNAYGGGIYHRNGTATISHSVISNNSAITTSADDSAAGGAIYNRDGNITVQYSTLDNNLVRSDRLAEGGGIFNYNQSSTIDHTTISNNRATDVPGSPHLPHQALGGGIRQRSGNSTINHSTISGNSASTNGGGISSSAALTVAFSTVTANSVTNNSLGIGGISGSGSINHTIAAENTPSDVSVGSALYSLIGILPDGILISLQFSVYGTSSAPLDPLLGPLANNGGPTMTHALLPGSPAIDMGASTAPSAHDQRGGPFARLYGERVDMGALESQPIPPAVFGDFSENGVVDAADYTLWQDLRGTIVPLLTSADGNGNGVVDAADYVVWKRNFGTTLSASPVGSAAISAAVEERLEHVDSSANEMLPGDRAFETPSDEPGFQSELFRDQPGRVRTAAPVAQISARPVGSEVVSGASLNAVVLAWPFDERAGFEFIDEWQAVDETTDRGASIAAAVDTLFAAVGAEDDAL